MAGADGKDAGLMPVVFVHGVPETSALWDGLIAAIDRTDVVTLQLPGFGCPRPDGFGATKEDYVAWLIGELEAIDGPIDLVGHDWGGGFTVRLVSTRPDLVRSWVSDAAGLGDIEFEWHDFAKIWQTPDEGEKFWADQLATPVEERAGIFELFGLTHDAAVTLAGMVDETMAGCILPLYRSAMTVGVEWAPDFHDIPKPGLVLIATEDAFLAEDRARTGATRAGAVVAMLEGLGHWWMLQDPARGAAALQEFWATL
jgi:pimeloyl-ACP methyl ester carboxylesterase